MKNLQTQLKRYGGFSVNFCGCIYQITDHPIFTLHAIRTKIKPSKNCQLMSCNSSIVLKSCFKDEKLLLYKDLKCEQLYLA